MWGVPYAADGWNEIVPDLFIGGHDRADGPDQYRRCPVIVHNQFDLVISLYQRDGHGPGPGVEHHYLSIPDGALLAADAVRCGELADTAAAAVQAGRKVLVRCQAGYNRSGLVTALTLIRLGHDADKAISLIRERRSRYAMFNEHFLAHLRKEVPAPKRIQFSRRRGARMSEGAVYVGRHTSPTYGRWGNPFPVGHPCNDPLFRNAMVGGVPLARQGVVEDRAHAVELFAFWLMATVPYTQADVRRELAGKNLACWCPLPAPGQPDLCHGALLLRVANGGEP